MHFPNQYEMMKEKKGIVFNEPSRTKQEFKQESDINFIVKRYSATGIIDNVASFRPVYADVTQFNDLAGAYDIVNKAEQSFMALPSELRVALGHNPRNLPAFICNPANRDLCIKYGIFEKPIPEVSNRVVTPKGSPAQSST